MEIGNIKKLIRIFIAMFIALLFSYIAVIAKVAYAFIYTNILLFNIFDLVVYGVLSFSIGYISRWREPIITVILVITFIFPSLVFVGHILSGVYITRVPSYSYYEWIASFFVIPFAAFIGALISKRLILKKIQA